MRFNKGSAHVGMLIVIVVLLAVVGYLLLTRDTGTVSTEVSDTAIFNTETPSTNVENIQFDTAEDALIAYFAYLSGVEYHKAALVYGGDYDTLADWSPRTPEANYAELLENGCEFSGLNCLPIREIISHEVISSTQEKFVVQFENMDGSTFERGPCCGATEEEMPTQTDFSYTVELNNGKYLVLELPVYTP